MLITLKEFKSQYYIKKIKVMKTPLVTLFFFSLSIPNKFYYQYNLSQVVGFILPEKINN